MVAAAAKNPEVKPADRKIAKTMLDFRADELFELANSEIDTLVDDPTPAPTPLPSSPPAAVSPPEIPSVQPRKVAKTMLEVDVPHINANAQAAQPAPSQPIAPEPVTAGAYCSGSQLPLNLLSKSQSLRSPSQTGAPAMTT